MKFAFRKINGWNPIRHIIGWVTGGKYCHVEGVFSDGTWVGVTTGGVRFARPGEISGNPAKWDFVEVHITTYKEGILRTMCEIHRGTKYDFAGIASYITFGVIKQDPSKPYCSEFWRDVLGRLAIAVLPFWWGRRCPPSGKNGLYEMIKQKRETL